MKVGEVAKATGISVRTLHHYEEIGLLVPSARSESGHRVYSASDIRSLQQILSLKQLGFALDAIRECLVNKNISPLEIIRMHQARVLKERDQLGQLYEQLGKLEKTLASQTEPTIQELLTTIEVIQMHEKYFSKEQLAELKVREQSLGEDKMKNYQNDWTDLMEKVRAEAKKGTDPSSAYVQELAVKWNSLVKAFSGGNKAIEVQLGSMYRNEPAMRDKAGMDPEVYEYVAKMMSYMHKK